MKVNKREKNERMKEQINKTKWGKNTQMSKI